MRFGIHVRGNFVAKFGIVANPPRYVGIHGSIPLEEAYVGLLY